MSSIDRSIFKRPQNFAAAALSTLTLLSTGPAVAQSLWYKPPSVRHVERGRNSKPGSFTKPVRLSFDLGQVAVGHDHPGAIGTQPRHRFNRGVQQIVVLPCFAHGSCLAKGPRKRKGTDSLTEKRAHSLRRHDPDQVQGVGITLSARASNSNRWRAPP